MSTWPIGAATTLLRDAPEKLWRRIGGLAFEEVGLADMGVTELATIALGGKRFRASVGAEWCVASTVVGLAARAAKCRAADDLLMAAELHPTFTEARRELAAMSTRELPSLMIGAEPLPVRALASWFAIGTDRRPSPHLGYRRGDPQAVFDVLNEAGFCAVRPIRTLICLPSHSLKTGQALSSRRRNSLANAKAFAPRRAYQISG
jgi:hypothetical protein